MSYGSDGSTARTCDSERREARRYGLDWPVTVIGIDNAAERFEVEGTLRDLSSNGAYTYLENLPPVGSKLSISIKLPFNKEVWMSYSAQAVRVEAETAGTGVALKFDTSRPEFENSRKREEYLARLLSTSGECECQDQRKGIKEND